MLAAIIAIPVAAVLLRAATEHVPAMRFQRVLPASIALAGHAPVLAWPREGQAAVAVEGVGSLGTSGAQVPAPIASVAKMMTAYLTLKQHPLLPGQSGFTITITAAEAAEEQERAAEEQSVVPVRAGERLSERKALEALMLPSANNVAALLAVHDAGSIEAFVARMNAQAGALGMHATTYTDPSGFEDTTVSTAADQLKLAKVAMQNPTFASIVAKRSALLPVVGRVFNYDELVGQEGYVGVKTGSDRAAGGCLVFAKHVAVDGHRLTVLGVVLGQRDGSLIEAAIVAAQQLGNSAAASLRVQTALPAGARVLLATSADGAHTAAVTAHAIQEIGWPGLRLPLRVAMGHRGLELHTGQRLAGVEMRGVLRGRSAAVAHGALAAPSFGWRLGHLL